METELLSSFTILITAVVLKTCVFVTHGNCTTKLFYNLNYCCIINNLCICPLWGPYYKTFFSYCSLLTCVFVTYGACTTKLFYSFNYCCVLTCVFVTCGACTINFFTVLITAVLLITCVFATHEAYTIKHFYSLNYCCSINNLCICHSWGMHYKTFLQF
jgi:hypothetical protein